MRARRLKLISEFVSSSNSKRSLNYHLNLTWCSTQPMATCRWCLNSCNLSRSLSSIHSPVFLETCSAEATCSRHRATSRHSRISSRYQSNPLRSLNLNRARASLQTCKSSKLQWRNREPPRRRGPSPTHSLPRTNPAEAEARERTIKRLLSPVLIHEHPLPTPMSPTYEGWQRKPFRQCPLNESNSRNPYEEMRLSILSMT